MSKQNLEKPTPPSEAWNQMKKLLDKEMPTDKYNRRRYLILFFLLLIGGGIYTWYNYILPPTDKSLSAVANLPVKDVNGRATTSAKNESSSVSALSTTKQTSKTTFDGNTRVDEPIPRASISGKSSSTDNKQLGNTSDASTNSLSPKSKTPDFENKSTQSVLISKATVRKPAFVTISKSSEASKGISNTNHRHPALTMQKYDSTNAPIAFGTPVGSLTSGKSDVKKSDTTTITKTDHDPRMITKTAVVVTAQTNSIAAMPLSPKHKFPFHFGLEWSVPLPFDNNTVFKEVNAHTQPLTALIPAVWASKEISAKATLQLSINPYAQYLLNHRSVLKNADYSITAVGESNINQSIQPTQLAQTFTLYKVTGVEAVLQCAYTLSRRWSIAAGISNMWTNTALFKESIVKNNSQTIKDSLFGVIKTESNWSYVNNSFFSGRINLAYAMKRYQAGVAFIRPLSNVYVGAASSKTPVNMQVFFRWRIR